MKGRSLLPRVSSLCTHTCGLMISINNQSCTSVDATMVLIDPVGFAGVAVPAVVCGGCGGAAVVGTVGTGTGDGSDVATAAAVVAIVVATGMAPAAGMVGVGVGVLLSAIVVSCGSPSCASKSLCGCVLGGLLLLPNDGRCGNEC